MASETTPTSRRVLPPAPRAADVESWLAAREPALRRLAHLLCPDPHDAADLLQATLTRLYLAWPRLQGLDSPDGYARRVMLNQQRSWWARAFRRREVPAAEPPDRAVTASVDDGTRDVVWQLVAGLPRRQRAVLVLRYYEELSEAEIADVLGVSTGTVKSQASRALARLRDQMKESPS